MGVFDMGRWLVATVAVALLLVVGAPAPALGASPLTLTARLTSAAVVPPVNVPTSATGEAVVVINAERTELTYRITYRALSSPLRGVAFCIGWSTTNMVCPFIGAEVPIGPSPLVGTRSIVGIQADDWTSGQAWVALWTKDNPTNELRGLLSDVPATSTILASPGGSVDWTILVLLLASGTAGGWAFWRRLDGSRPGRREAA
jgi:hypothetical protein